MIKYRGAVPADADNIARVIGAVWPGQDVRSARIASTLANENRGTSLALFYGELVGFVDGFLTWTDEGRPRWEVDLLAVLPAARGRGIGTELIRRNVVAGLATGAESIRALVRCDNIGAMMAFERSGFAADAETGVLYVCDCSGLHDNPNIPDGLHLVSVFTLAYSGIWLEGRLSKPGFSAALGECARRGMDLAGVVIPESKGYLARAARAADYKKVGKYRWLRRGRDQFTR